MQQLVAVGDERRERQVPIEEDVVTVGREVERARLEHKREAQLVGVRALLGSLWARPPTGRAVRERRAILGEGGRLCAKAGNPVGDGGRCRTCLRKDADDAPCCSAIASLRSRTLSTFFVRSLPHMIRVSRNITHRVLALPSRWLYLVSTEPPWHTSRRVARVLRPTRASSCTPRIALRVSEDRRRPWKVMDGHGRSWQAMETVERRSLEMAYLHAAHRLARHRARARSAPLAGALINRGLDCIDPPAACHHGR